MGPENIADEEIMVPVDMRGVDQDFDDVEQMVEKPGPKGAAEAFLKAKEYFDANKDGEAEEERPKPMTAAEWKQQSNADSDHYDYNIFYVCKKTLDSLQEKLKSSEEITQDMVNKLAFPENIADEEIMVPVDMRGVEQDFDDVEQMVEKLGPKGAAEAFLKAKEYFDANKDGEPEEERPKPMTAAEWKQVLEEDDDEGEEEELLEGEEEEDLEEPEEEEGEGDEPDAKRARTG